MFFIVICILIVLCLIEIYVDNEMPKVTSFNIESNKIPIEFDGYKLLQLSDLHSKSFGDNNERLIKLIDNEKPNIIVMTGDMVTANETDFTVFYNLIRDLKEKYVLCYIYGNHEGELENKNRKKLTDFLLENGVVILNNDITKLESGDAEINLYGLYYPQKYYSYKASKKYNISTKYIKEKIGTLDKKKYNILLTHNPLFFDAYVDWGADLTLSGHVHGGLIRLPFIGGLLSPERKFFPKYSAGLYENGDSKLIVSRGLSRGTKGFRFFNRPDVVSITLKSKKNWKKSHK